MCAHECRSLVYHLSDRVKDGTRSSTQHSTARPARNNTGETSHVVPQYFYKFGNLSNEGHDRGKQRRYSSGCSAREGYAEKDGISKEVWYLLGTCTKLKC